MLLTLKKPVVSKPVKMVTTDRIQYSSSPYKVKSISFDNCWEILAMFIFDLALQGKNV